MIRVLVCVVCLVGVCFAREVRADVTLPFSTTFNCSPSVQDDWFANGSQTGCDGIRSDGNDAAGSQESSIEASANYAGGDGGLGHKYWVNDSNGDNSNPNDVSGALRYMFTGGREANLYIRWHFLHQAGLNLDTSGGSHKFLYFNGDKCQGHTSGCYLLFQPSGILLHVGGGDNYGNSDVWGWDDLYPPSGSADGEWHCSQLEVQTGSGTNGVVRWTIDGTQRLQATNVDWGGTAGFSGFILPSNGVFDTRTAGGDAPMYMYFDDIAISTTSMPSCLSGGGGGSSSGSHPTGGVKMAPMINLRRGS